MAALFKGNGQFRLLLVYQIFSGLGGGVFRFFMLLSVHMMFDDVLFTGVAGFLMVVPHIFSFAVGPVVDRNKKVKIMRLTTLLEVLVLALLTFTPLLEWLGVVFMFGVVLAYSVAALFEGPAGNALLPQIVEENQILPANSMINITAMLGGIGVAAFLFAVSGNEDDVQNMFTLVYGISTVFLLLAFAFSLLLREPAKKAEASAETKPHSYIADLKAGGKFLRKTVLMVFLVVFVIRVMFAEMAHINLPAFVEYHAGAQGYIVLAVMGMLGGVTASSLMGVFGSRFKLGWCMAVLFFMAGAARIGFAFALPQSFYAGLFAAFFFSTVANASGLLDDSLWQRLPPKDMVGRVTTLQTTSLAVSIALGALLGGAAGRILPDVGYMFIIQGTAIILLGLAFILAPSARNLPRLNDIDRHEGEADE